MNSAVMKLVMTKGRLILFSLVIFVAHTLADPRDEAWTAFKDHRQRQLEARNSARMSADLQSGAASGVPKPSATIQDMSQGNWAGAVQSIPTSGTFNSVSAKWIVPAVSAPASSTGANTWWVCEWVGIDGTESCTTASLAAGVHGFQTVSDSGQVTSGALAWYQWYPASLTEIGSFSVAAGNEVQVSVTATSSSQGTVVLENHTTGESRTISVTPPSPDSDLCGATAEWIVEQMTDPNSGDLDPLGRFDNVFFENCAATTTSNTGSNLNGASILSISQNSVVLAIATPCSNTELEVYYNDPTGAPTPCGHS